MKGRRPLPTTIKLLRGNPGKRPLNDREPQPARGVPSCPAHLDAAARAEWRRITRDLAAAGLLTLVDRAALAAYCQAWSQWAAASKALQGAALVETTEKGYAYANPLIGIAKAAADQMRQFLIEFGMTPASRTRIKVPRARPADDDEAGLDEFLRGKRTA